MSNRVHLPIRFRFTVQHIFICTQNFIAILFQIDWHLRRLFIILNEKKKNVKRYTSEINEERLGSFICTVFWLCAWKLIHRWIGTKKRKNCDVREKKHKSFLTIAIGKNDKWPLEIFLGGSYCTWRSFVVASDFFSTARIINWVTGSLNKQKCI